MNRQAQRKSLTANKTHPREYRSCTFLPTLPKSNNDEAVEQ